MVRHFAGVWRKLHHFKPSFYPLQSAGSIMQAGLKNRSTNVSRPRPSAAFEMETGMAIPHFELLKACKCWMAHRIL